MIRMVSIRRLPSPIDFHIGERYLIINRGEEGREQGQ